MRRVAHDAHDAKRKQHPRPQYAESISMLFLCANVGNVGRTVFFAGETCVLAAHELPTMPTASGT
jgi:hypothetical protein